MTTRRDEKQLTLWAMNQDYYVCLSAVTGLFIVVLTLIN